jgi:hypothetical protein
MKAYYYSNELWNVNTLHERKLCSRTHRSEQSSVSMYRVYYVSVNISMCICEL